MGDGKTFDEIVVNGKWFTIHQEPTRAQKEIDDDDPPGPWPWWSSGDKFAGGPYPDKVTAVNAIRHWVATGEGNNLDRTLE